METKEVSHNEIYDRLLKVEEAVSELKSNTADLIAAFEAARGAFTVLEWTAKVVKPLLLVGSFLAAIAAYWNHK